MESGLICLVTMFSGLFLLFLFLFLSYWPIYCWFYNVIKIKDYFLSLLGNRQTQQINEIGHELQGVLFKVRQTTCFGLPRPSSGPKS